MGVKEQRKCVYISRISLNRQVERNASACLHAHAPQPRTLWHMLVNGKLLHVLISPIIRVSCIIIIIIISIVTFHLNQATIIPVLCRKPEEIKSDFFCHTRMKQVVLAKSALTYRQLHIGLVK